MRLLAPSLPFGGLRGSDPVLAGLSELCPVARRAFSLFPTPLPHCLCTQHPQPRTASTAMAKRAFEAAFTSSTPCGMLGTVNGFDAPQPQVCPPLLLSA